MFLYLCKNEKAKIFQYRYLLPVSLLNFFYNTEIQVVNFVAVLHALILGNATSLKCKNDEPTLVDCRLFICIFMLYTSAPPYKFKINKYRT